MDTVDSTGRSSSSRSSRQRGHKRHGSRYKARRRAVELLFEGEARNTDPVDLADERGRLALDPEAEVSPVAPYTRTIIEGVAVNLDFIDDSIVAYLTDGWELDRIAAVDRAILRVGFFELVFNPDVPVKTAVVEATELASQYSGEQASRYINALMDRAARDHAVLREAAHRVAGGVDAASPDEKPARDIVDEPVKQDQPEVTVSAPIGGLYLGPSAAPTVDVVETGRSDTQIDQMRDVAAESPTKPIGGLYLGPA